MALMYVYLQGRMHLKEMVLLLRMCTSVWKMSVLEDGLVKLFLNASVYETNPEICLEDGCGKCASGVC